MIPIPDKQVVLGVGISKTDYSKSVDVIADWVAQERVSSADRARYVCITSVHGIITAQDDPAFLEALNQADMATPDGMPVVWSMRSFGVRGQQRVYGPTLMMALCERAAASGHRIFLYGARQETLDCLSTNLLAKFPNLQIAGVFAPPFRPLTAEEDEQVVKQICDSKADIVFVGLSTPKQEFWMRAHLKSLAGRVMIGVGAAFDFHAGRVRQAPSFVQQAGFEWLFRLVIEPKRLWRRYILTTPRFLPLWALQKVGVVRYASIDGNSQPRLTTK